jgi:hypothetical protein
MLSHLFIFKLFIIFKYFNIQIKIIKSKLLIKKIQNKWMQDHFNYLFDKEINTYKLLKYKENALN